MTEEDVQNLPLEEIIHLPNFHSLIVVQGYMDGKPPYWEITFEATERIKEGAFKFLGRISPFKYFKFYRINH